MKERWSDIRQAKWNLGRMIAARIRKQGFKWVAKEADIDHQTLFRLLNGQGQFEVPLILRLAQLAALEQEKVHFQLRIIHAPAPVGPRRLTKPPTVKRRARCRFR